MNTQIKNLLIGIFVIGACVLLVSIILFLKPSVGDMKKTYYAAFSNINKINIGTRVMYAGKPVGEVVAIKELPDPREQPTDSLGRVYVYELVLKVDSSVNIYNTDEISLQTSGLLGEKSIAIIPKAPPKGVTPKLITDQLIYADSVDPIENTFVQVSELADKAENTVDRITKWFDENSNNLSFAIKSFGEAMHEIDTTVATMNNEGIVLELKKATQSFGSSMQQINDAFEQMKQDCVFQNLGATMVNVKSASQSIDTITQDIANGTGTLGRIVKGDDLYLRFTAILSKVDTLMNDVNHYGLLFNLNKGWQRTRTQRMNVLNALNTPDGFKNYFEKEVDDINTAMSRISTLIDKAQTSPEKEAILSSDLFKKDFTKLLNEVDTLRSNLQLYTEQLMEAQAN